jgi:hypothetical protein
MAGRGRENSYSGGAESEEMSPNAGHNAALIFVAVMGGAAIWFGWFIWVMRRLESYTIPFARIVGVPGAVGAFLFGAVVLSYWR